METHGELLRCALLLSSELSQSEVMTLGLVIPYI